MDNIPILEKEHTLKLLRECDAGIKTAMNSIREVLGNINSAALRKALTDSLNKHEYMKNEIDAILSRMSEEGKEPNPVARAMSWAKINMKLLENPEDKTVAKLMFEGCNMGIEQVSGYLNDYSHADSRSREIAERLISTEDELAQCLREYL
ncbi:MAG: hypothetical protein IJ491_02460 [Clostridia bacterium]|nr:hypothetical protein [Clostridia bacterium]